MNEQWHILICCYTISILSVDHDAKKEAEMKQIKDEVNARKEFIHSLEKLIVKLWKFLNE